MPILQSHATKKRTVYEWAVETLDTDGEIEDVDIYDTLANLRRFWPGALDGSSHRVALRKIILEVWADGSGDLGADHVTYAYVEDGELSACFDDGSSVPKSKRDEVARLSI